MDFDIHKLIKLIIGNKDNLLFPIKKEAQVCDALVSTIRSLYPKYRVTVEVDVKLNLEIWNNSRSARIDIVVDDNNGNFIPIEVKFKKQGINKATDEGKFHFFYDLYRIEYLKQLNCIPNTVLKNFVSGYSIMFTNHKDYLTDKNKKNANKPTKYWLLF